MLDINQLGMNQGVENKIDTTKLGCIGTTVRVLERSMWHDLLQLEKCIYGPSVLSFRPGRWH